MSKPDETDAVVESKPSPGVGQQVADILTSLRFAITIVSLLAVACVVGTVLPQGGDAVRYLQAHPEAKDRMELLRFLGLTQVYTSRWFMGLLGLLSASLVVCTFRRCRVARKTHGRARGRAIGSILTHISLLLILAGGVVRAVWGERGNISFREGETSHQFVVDGVPRNLPFKIHLAKFEIETYRHSPAEGEGSHEILAQRLQVIWPQKQQEWLIPIELNKEEVLAPEGETPSPDNSYKLTILRFEPSFVVDRSTHEITSRTDEPKNPAILVEVVGNSRTNSQWLFALHPEFDMHNTDQQANDLKMRYQIQVNTPPSPTIKDYKSTLKILEGDIVVKEKTIEVNSPLSYKGYTFYQTGYNPNDPKWTSLQVVRDPGVPVVYAGFLLMLVGLTAVFYVYPQTSMAGKSGREQKETK